MRSTVVLMLLGMSIGVALAAPAETPEGTGLTSRETGSFAGCESCLAKHPADPRGCNLDRVVSCMQRLQDDVEWFEGMLIAERSSVRAKAEQQARILDLLEKIGLTVVQPDVDPADVRELVDKLRREVGVSEPTDGPATPTTPAEAPEWRQGLQKYFAPRVQEAEARLAALLETVTDEPPATREMLLGELRRVSDSLWEAGIAAGAVPAPASMAQEANSRDTWQLPLPESGVQGRTSTGRRVLLDGATNTYLFDAYHAYHQLKERLARLRACSKPRHECATPPAVEALDAAESRRLQLRETLRRVLRRQGLDQPLMGVLAAGVGFSRAPDKDGQSAAESAQSLVVRFESKHLPVGRLFGVGPLDVGLLGKFGVQPVFDMIKPEDPSKFSRVVITEQTGPNEFTRLTTEESTTRVVCPTAESPASDCQPASPPTFAAQYATRSSGTRACV